MGASEMDSRTLLRRRRVALVIWVVSLLAIGLPLGALLAFVAYQEADGTLVTVLVVIVAMGIVLSIPTTLALGRLNREIQERGIIDFAGRSAQNVEKRKKSFRLLLFLIPAYAVFLVGSKFALNAMDEADALPWMAVGLLIGAACLALFFNWLSLRQQIARVSALNAD